MKRILQIALPIVILASGGWLFYAIMSSEEEPERRRFQAASPAVVTRLLETTDFQVTLHSQGTVRARTESTLIPEVRGRIIKVSRNFREGAFFEAGEVLLEIEDSDYRTELIVAEGVLAQAELRLLEEQARYEQARRDWERLNPGQEAASLTLREPQLRQAEAAVASAQARVDAAKLNLERTKVTAPYAGRILTKSVDFGQVVSTNTQLAQIYAVDFAEVRLPLTASQVGYLNLPSIYRGSDPSIEDGPQVTLSSSIGGKRYSWEGRVVRSEGAVDMRSRQLFVVAQVEDPYGEKVPGRPPLKVGTFVEAAIEGTTLRDVFVVPRNLFRENRYVLVVDEDSYLDRRVVDVVWENDSSIFVRDGLEVGDRLCLTDVPYALEGWQVVATNESKVEVDEAVADSGEDEPRRERRPAPSGEGVGERIDAMIAHFGEQLPGDLKEKLMDIKGSGDPTSTRTVMREVRTWAEENNLEMPAGGRRPRS